MLKGSTLDTITLISAPRLGWCLIVERTVARVAYRASNERGYAWHGAHKLEKS